LEASIIEKIIKATPIPFEWEAKGRGRQNQNNMSEK
jgi:hypothetical protein